MAIRKIWASRVKNTTAEEFVGQKGTIFFNEPTGALRISDGVTVGGNPLTLVASDFQFQFGDFIATTGRYTDSSEYAVLSSSKTNEDIAIASNGTGKISIVGEFTIHATDGSVTGSLETKPTFQVSKDGQTTIVVPATDPNAGAVEIIGSISGASQPTVNTGVMLHITGNNGDASRIYNDGIGSFAAYVARRYNGTAASPTAVLADEELMRISGTAHNGTSIPGTGNQRIVYKALGNQTPSNQGGYIELWATPQNSTTIAKVATIDNANGITATKFTGPLTGNVTGNATSADKVNHTLTFGTHLTGTSFDGSSAVTIATDATTTATANVLVARDANGMITAQNYKGNSRDAGTLGTGSTLTINYAIDHIVLVNITGAITIAHTNITAGRNVKVFVVNTTGGNLAVTTGLADLNVTGGNANANVNANRTGAYEFVSFGTTTTTLYCNLNR